MPLHFQPTCLSNPPTLRGNPLPTMSSWKSSWHFRPHMANSTLWFPPKTAFSPPGPSRSVASLPMWFRPHSKELSLIPVFASLPSTSSPSVSPSACSLVGALLFYAWMTAVVSYLVFAPCYSLHSSQRTLKKGRWITLPFCLKPSYGFLLQLE